MTSCKTTNFPNGLFIGSCLEVGPGVINPFPESIVEVSAAQSPYLMLGTEDVIFCTGIVEIIMIPLSTAIKSFLVNADGGDVMMTPDGTDTIQDAIVSDGNSMTFGPKFSASQWRTLTTAIGNYS